jgi:hypothetical protein
MRRLAGPGGRPVNLRLNPIDQELVIGPEAVDHGIIFGFALAHIGRCRRHAREPVFGDRAKHQERRRHPRARVNAFAGVRAGLLFRGQAAAKMS